MTKTLRTWVHVMLAMACLATVGQAQSVFLGTVVGDGGSSPPLAGAELTIPVLNVAIRTDSLGRFLVKDIPRGVFRVTIRRVGFEAMVVNAHFTGRDTLAADFAMTALAVSLDTFSVQGTTRQHGKFLEFEDRRTHGVGAYLTRADVEREEGRQLGEIVSKLSGVRVNRYGAEIAVATSRWAGASARGGDAMDRRKGAPRACYSQVYVDNVRVFSAGVGEALFNINSIAPSTIQGIEYYASRAETPIQYATSQAECGTMLIWTRIE